MTTTRDAQLAMAAAFFLAWVCGLAIALGRYEMLAVPVAVVLLIGAFLYPVLALAAMLAVVPIEGYGSLIPGTFTLPRLLGFVAFACFAANILVQRKRLAVSSASKWFALFAIWAFASTLWASDKAPALTLVVVIGQLLVFFVMCENILAEPRALRIALLAYYAGSVVSAVMAIRNYSERNYATRFLERVSSVEDMNPNDFARMIGFGLLAGLYLLFERGKRGLSMIVLACYPLLLVGLLLSKGRGAWLALLCALFTLFLIVRKSGRVYAAAGVVTAMFAATTVTAYQLGYLDKKFEERLEETVEGKDPTAQRVDIWKVGFALFADNPIAGVGLNNFPVRFNDYLHQVQTNIFPGFNKDPHNVFLSILGETGLVGLGLFGSLLAVVVVWLRRAGRTWEGGLATAIFTFTLVAGLSGTDYIRKWYWFSLAVAYILARKTDDARARSQPYVSAP